MGSTGLRVVAVIVVLAILAGCGRSSVVRRESGAQPVRTSPAAARTPAGTAPAEAVVARGDTLYGLAFRHGLDYREVARWNGIGAPYTIYPGQRIRLHPPGGAVVASQAPSAGRAASGPAPTRSSRPGTGSARGGSAPAQSQAQAPAAGQSGAAPAASPSTGPAPSVSGSTPAASAPAQAQVAASGPVAWRWPADGELVGRFVAGESTRQGIDIAGQSGQEVRAAADGVVVYSGSGLVGYGELIIIKHTDEWLSAYGHNRRRLVEEGQSVRGGQQVAEMGRSGASRDMLHFEIRRNGRPVDPLQHLPRR